jgi:tRNA nucleotidyltransferase (CCA-adding enzyme)
MGPITVEKKGDKLESLLGQFMTQTNRAITKMEKGIENLKEEMKKFQNEMSGFKDDRRGFKDSIEEEIKRSNKKWVDMANKMGTLVEDIVAPAIPRVAAELFGCEEIEDFMVRRSKTKLSDKSYRREFDVLAICQNKVIFNETKSTPRTSYIDDFIKFLRDNEFYEYFPEYKDKELIPIFSSLYLPADVVARLSKNRIYAMAMSDSVMEILNYDECRSSAG